MKTTPLLVALSALFPAVALAANPVHNVWATQPGLISEPGASYVATSASCSFSWTEVSGYAFINARAKAPTGDLYEFQLVSVTGSPTAYEVDGLWNVSKNGVPLCTGCSGLAYGLTAPIGSMFKIYVGNYSYHLSGSVTNRYDF
ncbi:hypothetical protein [Archangium sp.]|uniref:hypothetical protein n=1 Tax=Archangium sp. TaxID=1872627 RepID=UPI003899FCBF